MHQLIPRTALVLLSIVLLAWSAVLWRNEHIGSEASDRILQEPGMSDSDWMGSLDRLREAEFLDPSLQWKVSRATAQLLRDKPGALRLADSALDREPDNLEAWLVVFEATRGRDAARAERAQAELLRLNPPVPGG